MFDVLYRTSLPRPAGRTTLPAAIFLAAAAAYCGNTPPRDLWRAGLRALTAVNSVCTQMEYAGTTSEFKEQILSLSVGVTEVDEKYDGITRKQCL